MYFRMLQDEQTGAFSYLLADLDAAEAVLIDPRGADAAVLRAMLSEHRLTLRWLVRTHVHEEAEAREGREALAALSAPQVERRTPREGMLAFGSEHLAVFATPGHSAGCLSYRWRDRVFCGDLLSVDACPYRRVPELPAALWDSVMRKIFTLPAETLLFCAHCRDGHAVSTVLEQRRSHPWFARASRDEFLARFREAAEVPA